MKSKTNNQEIYYGLFGLDKLPSSVKAINFIISVIIGTNLAFDSWGYELRTDFLSSIPPQFLPLVFVWPLCGIILWLRLTGLKWSWCLVACGIVFIGYCLLRVFDFMAREIFT